MCFGRSPAERPIHQPIHHTVGVEDFEILFENTYTIHVNLLVCAGFASLWDKSTDFVT